MSSDRPAIKGRGAADNPRNRFERIDYVPEPDDGLDPQRPATAFYHDLSRSILSRNDSPDVGFSLSINPYRGCEHGCAYCYARPTHEYLGFSAGLDFETQILVKTDAADLLRKTLASPRWRPEPVALSGVTDPYQPAERRLRVTRRVLEVLAEFRNPVSIVTKNHLVTRDIDLLGELARLNAASAYLSITSLDAELTRVLEPRTSHPERRLAAIRALAEAGVPTGVLVAPVIPGLNDQEIPAVLEAAADAGAGFASTIMLRLPHGVAPMFAQWLDTHRPDRKQRVLNRIRDARGGKLNETAFGRRMRGQGVYADQIRNLFEVSARRAGLRPHGPDLSTAHFRQPSDGQGMLFAD